MMMTCLRWVMGDKLTVAGREVVLGAGIPHFEVVIVESRQGDIEAALYCAAHEACLAEDTATDPGLLEEDESDERRPANVRRCRLQHAALNPALDQMYLRNVGTEAKGVQRLFQQGIDSFTVYYTYTKSDLHHPAPDTRPAMAQYIASTSSKLQALSEDLLQVVICEDRKMLIYANWPLNLWLVELFLSVIQIEFLSIRAGVKTNKRLEAENEYNNNPKVKVLVCSSRSASESLNLQKGGWHTVVMDLIPMNVLKQIIGRSFRVGATHPQLIKVLTTDETYDQYLQQRYFANYNAEVAVTAKLPVADNVLLQVDNATRTQHDFESKDRHEYHKFLC